MHAPAAQPDNFWSLWSKARIQAIRYLTQLRRRWWLILLSISVCMLGAAWYVNQQPPLYLSAGRLMVAGQYRFSEGAIYSEEYVNFFGTQLELMQSGEVQKRAEALVLSLHPDLKPQPVKLEAGQLPRTSIFLMRTVGSSPEYTQAYLDACMDVYISIKKEMRSQKSDSTAAAIQNELVRLDKELQEREEEMHEFQKKNNLGFLREEGNSAGIYLAQINRQLADLRTEFELLNLLDLDQNLDRGQNSGNPSANKSDATLAGLGPMADYQRAKQQLQIYKADRDDYSRYLRPKHPTIVALDEAIARTERLIASFRDQSVESLKTRRESIRLQIQNLETVSKEWDQKALDLSRRVAEFDKLKSNAERIKNQYERLLANMKNLDVTKNIDQESISILEKASQARDIRPDLFKLLLRGFALGLVISLVWLWILDKLDDRVSSFVEFRNHFTEPTLGEIPRLDPGTNTDLLERNDPRHGLLESFGTLRSSLVFLPNDGHKPRILMVTSALPGEGKTTVACNLAIMMAFAGAKVLLVDADMRRGRIHNAFKLKQTGGLSDILRGRKPWRECLMETHVPNLSVILRGKHLEHPGEHILSSNTDQFLRGASAEYDYVILDSAPVMVADDALSLAPKADGVIFLVRFSQSSVRQCRRALDALSRRQTRLLGLVCNDVKASEAEYGYADYDNYAEPLKE